MRKFFSFRPFIDVLFCCLLMLVAILFLLKTEEEKTKSRPPNVIYEIILTWDGNSEDDLDLYVQASSGHIVSFNNREGGEGSLISLNHANANAVDEIAQISTWAITDIAGRGTMSIPTTMAAAPNHKIKNEPRKISKSIKPMPNTIQCQ